MRKKVIIINRLPDIVVSRLREKFDVKHFTTPLPKNDQTFKKELQNASGIIGYGFTVDDDILEHGSQLEIISTVSVGYNHLNVDLLTEKRILATNTPDVLTDTVADTIFGLLIATARRIPELDQYVKTGQWRGLLGADYYGTDVHHKTVGIIGMGRIGQAIAHRAHFGFHMDV